MNISELKQSITAVVNTGRTPHIIGKHGIGKTEAVRQWATENNYKVIEKRLGQMADPGDLIGLQEFIRDAKTDKAISTRHVLPEWFPREPRTIIFLDEINRSAKDILQAVFELVYDKSLGGVKIPEDCHVIAASNPPTDNYDVLDFSDSAFQDRFVHIQLEPSVQEWLTYGRSKSFANSVLDFIGEFPTHLEDKALQSFDLSFVKPSRRSWEAISRLEAQNLPDTLKMELTVGIIGLTAAADYHKFLKTYVKNIKPEEILADYKKVRPTLLQYVEKNRDDMIGLMNHSLKDHMTALPTMTRKQADNLLAMASDLPIEHFYSLFSMIHMTPALINIEGEVAYSFHNSKEVDELLKERQKARQEFDKKNKAKSKKKDKEEETL
jgi:hypothetical protein